MYKSSSTGPRLTRRGRNDELGTFWSSDPRASAWCPVGEFIELEGGRFGAYGGSAQRVGAVADASDDEPRAAAAAARGRGLRDGAGAAAARAPASAGHRADRGVGVGAAASAATADGEGDGGAAVAGHGHSGARVASAL